MNIMNLSQCFFSMPNKLVYQVCELSFLGYLRLYSITLEALLSGTDAQLLNYS